MRDSLRARMRQQLERDLMARMAKRLPAIPIPTAAPPPAPHPATDGLGADVLRLTAAALRMETAELDTSASLAGYGIDSIAITEVMGQIGRFLGVPLAPTVFFEAGTLDELVGILRARHPHPIAARYAAQQAVALSADVPNWIARHRQRKRPVPAPVSVPEQPERPHSALCDIAIIAMDGSFAGSPDIEALEAHLRAGDDCMSEVPPERWDWRLVDGDPKQGPFTRVRFGGFLPDHDAFDASFFGISPKEAELMDPQHRLFMQCVWRVIERAGHAPRSLAGQKVGLFLGINLQDYAERANRLGSIDPMQLTGLGHAFCANRLSFLLDLHGPSQVVDTACSSSLVALHRAVLSIRHEGCEMAIVGGSNLMLTPMQHILFSRVGMLAPDGRCKTFGAAANGYARGDGVGAVLLKRLDLAERDGNPILAVIRGSAENHGGHGSSLTAPNPAAQARLLIDAYSQAGIDPRSVGMIECHGTGTKLGDPVEIDGLKTAFAALFAERDLPSPVVPYCGLGSVKSNIGHTETAAGIAGVIKVLMALRDGRRYRSLHCTPPNPLIELTASPFFLLDTEQPWDRPIINGLPAPRRAGVSSFGAGGANAHVVLEEYQAATRPGTAAGPQIIPLSARDEPALLRMVARLDDYLDRDPQAYLGDLAFTLQLGRDALRTRLAVVVDSVPALRRALAAIGAGQHAAIQTARKAMPAIPADADLTSIATAWTHGGAVDWKILHPLPRRRVELPPYPFALTRFWLPQQAAPTLESVGVDAWHMRLEPESFFLRDHVVGGVPVLPGVMALELLSEAARRAGLPSVLRQVIWLAPLQVRVARVVKLTIKRDGRRPLVTLEGEVDGQNHLYAQARIETGGAAPAFEATDIDAIEAALSGRMAIDAFYQSCAGMGLAYGPAHRAVVSVSYGDGVVLARLRLPERVSLDGFVLHPSLADGAFQAALALAAGTDAEPGLPFALERLEVLRPCTADMVVHIRAGTAAAGQRIADLDLLDANGVLCARFRGFTTRDRSVKAAESGTALPPLLYVPDWSAAPARAVLPPAASRTVLFCGMSNVAAAVASARPGWNCIPSAASQDDFAGHAQIVLALLQAASQREGVVQVAVPKSGPMLGGLAGMVRAARLEFPRLHAQLVMVPDEASADTLAAWLDHAASLPDLTELRAGPDGLLMLTWQKPPHRTAKTGWQDNAVTLITGGLGRIGRLLADDIVTRSRDAVVVLTGRTAPDATAETWLRGLNRTQGAQVVHHVLDVTDAAAVAACVADIRQRHGRLDVVLHAAGLTHDGVLRDKTPETLAAVLAPKVAGTLALDGAIGNEPLALFVVFASLAGALGSPGQADYATANAFLDGFAAWREARRADGLRHGRTIAIDWPLWQDGGIRMPAQLEQAMTASTGLVALPTETAMAALDLILAGDESQVLVAAGDPTRIERMLNPLPAAAAVPRQADTGAVRRAVVGALEVMVSRLLKVSPEDLAPDIEFNEYGFDSISFTQFADALNQRFDLSLTPTLFFEHTTLARLAGHLALLPEVMTAFAALVAVAPDMPPVSTAAPVAPIALAASSREPDAIAIIGLSGVFPGAKDPDALWDVLREGRDCIDVMPEWRRGPGQALQGGFIDGIDQFDAAFFGQSAAEARMMDPQQRLLLTLAWRLLEDANIAPHRLWGAPVGVFVGIADTGYGRLLAAAGGPVEAQAMTGLAPSVAPNRISFHFNFTGPSVALETACSSALVAIHRAVSAIRAGECDVAIAGGINALLSVDSFEGFTKAGMLAPDGRSKSFADGANGYGRGEGGGLVLLKSLRDAERDGDTILAVVRASAENHGGRANSLTAPNPVAQSSLLRRAYRQAGFDPRSVGYIEAHGTGTPLGDPIETAALIAAFGELVSDAEARFGPAPPMQCGLGSVKSNIGHLELAAGIAGVTKVLLQMRHGMLAQSLHCATPNKLLALPGSPFRLVQQYQPWVPARDAAGNVLPRRAGVSSFGFGGSNAHVVLEEYQALHSASPLPDAPCLIVLSARSEAQLAAWVVTLRDAVPGMPADVTAADIAYTLQCCRDGMEHRLAFMCQNRQDLMARLEAIAAGRLDGVEQGQIRPNRATLALLDSDEAVRAALTTLPARGRYDLLLLLWVRGFAFDFAALYAGARPCRVRLPGLPLAATRHWVHRGAVEPSRLAVPQVSSPMPRPSVPAIDCLPRLTDIAARLLEAAAEDLDPDSAFGDFGFDSIGLTTFATQVNAAFGVSLTPADLFEFSTLGRLARHMAEHVIQPTREPSVVAPGPFGTVAVQDDPIAIVGLSCCFPGAPDAEQFWRNLRDGVDAISEIPPDRWDWRALDGDPRHDSRRTNIRWGGFIDNVLAFDPLFFGISPREAALMDPQQRLMLIHAWKAIEDSGHSPRSLAGRAVGVFVATASSGFSPGADEAGQGGGYVATGSVPSVGPNRISFFLDLHGPSEPVETACSSSLVAIHRAVQAIRAGDCEMALAGGVNTMVTPEGHLSFSKAGMLSPDGRCHTFSANANGYARGEGVGMLFLKPLSAAQRDGDPVYAIIRGSAINHGGHANSLTAPNTDAQAALLRQAYRAAGVDVASVGYIEAHGTGTALGDPVEVNALVAAFGALNPTPAAAAWCGIGAVKSGIGHLELAAGVAGTIKVLLQMRHGVLAPSLHAEPPNPYIKFEGTPFYVVKALQDWPPPHDDAGRVLPRRAGISGFGFGGVNAHVVLEEAPVAAVAARAQGLALVVLSAHSPERLADQVRQLLAVLDSGAFNPAELPDLEYTLQVGRAPLRERLAVVVNSLADLRAQLQGFLRGDVGRPVVGRAALPSVRQLEQPRGDDLHALAAHWVRGGLVDWAGLHGVAHRRLRLPTYPFSQETPGLIPEAVAPAQTAAKAAATLPLDPSDPMLRDHRVQGACLVAGAMILELARQAVAGDAFPASLGQIVWIKPVMVPPCTELRVDVDSPAVRVMANGVAHAQAVVGVIAADPVAVLDVDAIAGRCDREHSAAWLYDRFAALGMHYGPCYRSVVGLRASNREVLAELHRPEDAGLWGVHPAMLDGAFQACLGLSEAHNGGTALPFSIDRLDLLGPTTARMWAHVRARQIEGAVRRLDIDLASEDGTICVRVRGLAVRFMNGPTAGPVKPAVKADPTLRVQASAYLVGLLSEATQVAPQSIEPAAPLDAYGIDSVLITHLTERLEQDFGTLSKTLFFEHATLDALSDYFCKAHPDRLAAVLGHVVVPKAPLIPSQPLLRRTEARTAALPNEPIAIIGLAGRYPGAPTLAAFWDNLANGRDGITEVPPSRWDHGKWFDPVRQPGKTNSKWGGFLDGVDRFDASFFNISPREADFMDPQERLFLQCAWETIEDAGYTRAALAGTVAGVFVGVMYSEYQLYAAERTAAGDPLVLGASAATIANRVSYLCGLNGPSLAVDSMCSSSLTAIHLACDSLRAGGCEVALVGGVNLNLHPNKYLALSQGRFTSSNGRCASFGRGGDGYVPGEGVGAVLLKPLSRAVEDGDRVYATIRGSALNHGGKTNGYTVPNPHAQREVISRAMAAAGVESDEISYIEAHGTGTALGDPIEVAALSAALGGERGTPIAIGSVKSNIGHCESAAGIAGLSKVLLQLQHGMLVPSLHAETLNPHIDFAAAGLHVQQVLAPWPQTGVRPRIAGLSSFGAGGSNAHLVIAEHRASSRAATPDTRRVFVFSARDDAALGRVIQNFLDADVDDLAGAAFTLQEGREAFEHRVAVVATNAAALRHTLRTALGQGVAANLYRGVRRPGVAVDPAHMRDLDAVAAGWVDGAQISWDHLRDGPPCRIALPTYPFSRERHWFAPEIAVSAVRLPLLFTPDWQPRMASADLAHQDEQSVVVLCGQVSAESRDGASTHILVPDETDAAGRLAAYAVGFAEVLRPLLAATHKVLVQLVVPLTDDPGLPEALGGMLRSACHERPTLRGQIIGLDPTAPPVATILHAERHSADTDIRYQRHRRLVRHWAAPPVPPATSLWKDHGVYLITGGTGGLGQLLCREIARHARSTVLVLASRTLSGGFDAGDATVIHQACDVTDATAVAALVASIVRSHGKLDGVVHAAGMTRDRGLAGKSAAEIRTVLSAKVAGAVNLDAATAGLTLDIMLLFASAAGALGNAGQADYATANAFLDAFAAARNALVACGERCGATLSIDWPYWREGGMRMPDAMIAAMERSVGASPLDTAPAMAALNAALGLAKAGHAQVLVLDGDHARLRAVIAPAVLRPLPMAQTKPTRSMAELVRAAMAAVLLIDPARIDPDETFDRYGMDSVSAVQLAETLASTLGPLPNTLALEHPTLASLAAALEASHATAREPEPALLASLSAEATDIAVIAVAGRYPGADTIEAFWDALREGRDLVTEVPAERWDHAAIFDANKGQSGRTNCRWGGFLSDIDRFDADLFGISPRDAARTDPQERLFLEVVWSLLERAGHNRDALRTRYDSRVGVYAGAMYQQYQDLATNPDDRALLSLSSHAALANRVSFFFDLQGPSVAVDAMCASGLEAVHLACQGLLRGECRLAIAGAVNLSVHAGKYLGLSRAGMLGSDAGSRSFADGDGYLPAEAVGAVLLKPLADALRDRDEVLGVIKASASNHAGRSAGFGVPSLAAQARLIQDNLRASGVDPRSISYAEAAATGMPMADAIEMRAATQAFRAFSQDSGFCAIGSVKSNMGHAEAASGLAQLTKVLLQLQHRTLVPGVRAERLNPQIVLGGTPFRLQSACEPWQPASVDGVAQKLRATVSSFGAGGSNVHMVLQEAPVQAPPPQAPPGVRRFVFSAQTDRQLRQILADTADYVRNRPDLCLGRLAATLFFGRERLTCRAEIIASGRADLLARLAAWPDVAPPPSGPVLPEDHTLWPPLNLPPYPLARERYWLDVALAPASVASGNAEALILKVLAEETGHADPKPEARFRDLGATSMFGLRLIRACADELGLTLTNRDIENHPSARSLAAFLGACEPVAVSAPEPARPNVALPLSQGQAGLWAFQALHPEAGAYNVPLAFEAQGLNAEAVRQACAALSERFPILACRFPETDGVPGCVPTCPPVLHLVTMPEDADPLPFARDRARQPFDLIAGPPMRCDWLRSEQRDIVLLVVHHIVIDGLSALLIAQAFWVFYERFATGGALPLPRSSSSAYSEFVGWEGRFLASSQGERARAHWAQVLKPPAVMLELPTDRPANDAHAFDGRHIERILSPELTQTARRTATQLSINPSVLFLGVFQILLSRLCGTEDVLVGMPTLGRPEQRFEASVGLFANVIPVRTRIGHEDTVTALLSGLQRQVTDGLDHGFYPYASLCRELGQGGQPLHQFGYAYTNAFDLPLGEPTQLADGGRISPLLALRQEGDSLFALEISERRDTLQVLAVFNPSRLNDSTVNRMLDQFTHLLQMVCARPDALEGTLELLDAAGITEIVALGQGALLPMRPGQVCDWIAEVARLHPNALAATCATTKLRYDALVERARQLSAYLRAKDVGPGTRVAVLLSRGPESVVTLLAVMGSGAAWVPLDPGSPDERLALILRDCACAALITDAALAPRARALGATGRLVDLDRDASAIRRCSARAPFVVVEPSTVAYIIYTSGSTGRPKGVAVPHAALATHCLAVIDRYALKRNDVVLQFAQHDVDTALEQIVPTLVCGAELHMRGAAAWTPADLARAFEQGVNVADLPPAYLQVVLQAWMADADAAPQSVPRLVIVGGEAMPSALARLWRDGPLSAATLLNAYGPTEATITATVHTVGLRETALIPIGRPLPGVQLRILDIAGRPVPPGVPGELYIGGRLAVGYHGQPELTQARFVADPLVNGVLYRTGDRAVFLLDGKGTVGFLGRVDDQVQIRGFRVEPGEVEAAFAACGAPSCAVIARTEADGTASLIAFVSAPRDFDMQALTRAANAMLPPPARPAHVIRLDALPTMPSGKLDRQALALIDPGGRPQHHAVLAARDDNETLLLDIWRSVLGPELDLGVDDDFFAVGGHSLSAVRLASLVQQRFGQGLSISQLIESPTIASQARLLDRRPVKAEAADAIIRLRAGGDQNLFCVHPAGGTATCYLHLARALDKNWSVYGVQLATKPVPFDLPSLAADHVTAIRGVQPQGPYHLLGWSVGGIIALEVARQFELLGHAVRHVILLDSYTPAMLGMSVAHMGDTMRAFTSDLAESAGLDPLIVLPADLPTQPEALLEIVALHHALAGLTAARLKQIYRNFAAVLSAFHSHHPQSVDCPVTLYRAAEGKGHHRHGLQEFMAGLQTQDVVGRHGTILLLPNVVVLAQKIDAQLRPKRTGWMLQVTRWLSHLSGGRRRLARRQSVD